MMNTISGLPYVCFPENTPWSDVLDLLLKALSEHPQDELTIQKAIMPLAAGIEGKEEVLLNAADRVMQIATDPADLAEAMIVRADVLYVKGRDAVEAEALYMQAQALWPDFPEPYEKLFVICNARREFEKALEWARLMALQEELDHQAMPLVGYALTDLMRIPEAIEAFSLAIDLDPKNPDAYFGLANCYLMSDRFDEAGKIFIRAFECCRYPESAYAYAAGFANQCNDDPYRAMKWYLKALEIDPSHFDALNNMAVLQLELADDWNEAMPYLLRAVELSGGATTPSMRVVYRNLWVYSKQILDHEKAEYYHQLMMMCPIFDQDTLDFLDGLLDE
jgi:tetratricopeptide (TPR) repeat protein